MSSYSKPELLASKQELLERIKQQNVPVTEALLDKVRRMSFDHDFDETRSSTATEMDTGLATPTHSSTASFDDKESLHVVELSPGSVPSQGNVYAIRHRDSGKAITMGIEGLQLKKIGPMGGWHWMCVEKDGWLGFRNVVSGRYLGRNDKGGFHALQPHHQGWEYFVAKASPRGGYEMLTLHGWKFMKMSVAEDGSNLTQTDGDGARWDFVKYPILGSDRG
ncbi:hypothetical protein F4775DRAFT_548087 [Biscogniauxia sp. FL1348]|nr:hypothetical protein F4775DRAFT_548087 [Biscogniauxia sp. FL1348]